MITINGQKMGKSLGNFITLDQFFTGEHDQLEQAYSPMTIRFFILSAHYRGTVDFSNEALKAAEKGLARLLDAAALLDGLQAGSTTSIEGIQVSQSAAMRLSTTTSIHRLPSLSSLRLRVLLTPFIISKPRSQQRILMSSVVYIVSSSSTCWDSVTSA